MEKGELIRSWLHGECIKANMSPSPATHPHGEIILFARRRGKCLPDKWRQGEGSGVSWIYMSLGHKKSLCLT